jgi:hypothetical protein
MKDIEKLRVMLPHWIEHNRGHGEEFSQWADKLIVDVPGVAQLLKQAVGSLQDAQVALEEALAKAGGPLEGDGHKHGHHHHDGDHHHHH